MHLFSAAKRRESAPQVAGMPAGSDPVSALNRAFELDRSELLAEAIRRANRIAMLGLAVGALGVASAALLAGLHKEIPVIVTVDRTTGETSLGIGSDIEKVPGNEALDKAELARYIEAREGYDYNWLQRDYSQVAATSVEEVFADFGAKFLGKDALHTRLGRNQLWRVQVRVVTPSRKGAAQVGEATVSWDLEQISLNNQFAPRTLNYVSTLRYTYNAGAKMTEAARRLSPLGFLVTAYRRDEDTKGAQ